MTGNPGASRAAAALTGSRVRQVATENAISPSPMTRLKESTSRSGIQARVSEVIGVRP